VTYLRSEPLRHQD